MTIFALHCDN